MTTSARPSATAPLRRWLETGIGAAHAGGPRSFLDAVNRKVNGTPQRRQRYLSTTESIRLATTCACLTGSLQSTAAIVLVKSP